VRRQRDAAAVALADADDDDVILIADADEFPPRGYQWDFPGPACAFSQRLAMYAADWLYPEPHVCSVAARMRYLRGRWDTCFPWGLSLSLVRDARMSLPRVDGGWHITWLGGPEACAGKLKVIAHTEMRADERERLASGACWREGIHQSGEVQMIPADVDESWPEAIWKRECPPSWFRPRP